MLKLLVRVDRFVLGNMTMCATLQKDRSSYDDALHNDESRAISFPGATEKA